MLKKVLKMAAATVALLILKRRIAIAAAAIAVGSALTVAVASAGTNLVTNGYFSNGTQGWTPVLINPWPNTNGASAGTSYIQKFDSPADAIYRGGDPYEMWIACTKNCPTGKTQSIYQKINSLITGHKYELTFYAYGEASDNLSLSQVATMNVGFGSQTFGPFSLPLEAPPYPITAWMQKTLDFTYTGLATSAALSFIQNLSWGLQTGCEPCVNYLAISNVTLNDVTPVAAAPTLSVQKALGTGGRVNNADQFKVSILNAATSAVLGSGSTAGTGSTITGGLANITGDTTTNYKVVEEMVSGSASSLAQYSAALSCTNANSAGTQFPAGSVSLGQNFPLLAAGDQVSCTLTNTLKAPTVRLTKALGAGGRANNADQFTVLVQQRLSTIASGTSTGSGGVISAGSTGWTNLVAGTSYNLGEVMASGSASNLAAYTGVLSCSNALAGSSTVLPTAPGAAFTPTYGDVLDCTLTNTPKPATLTVTQKVIVTAPATFNPPLTLSYTGTNGWTLQKNNSTVLNTVTTGATQTLAALKLATTLTVAVSTSEIGWKIASIRCTDTNAAVSGNPLPPTVLVSSTNNTIVIPANLVSAGAALQCAVIGSRQI